MACQRLKLLPTACLNSFASASPRSEPALRTRCMRARYELEAVDLEVRKENMPLPQLGGKIVREEIATLEPSDMQSHCPIRDRACSTSSSCFIYSQLASAAKANTQRIVEIGRAHV